MVWGGISEDGKTDLLVIEGNLNANRYVQEVLIPHVVPYAGAIGDGFVLMDDNARPHRGRVVDQFIDDQGIERMEWPANSPDLNPIELLWDQLKQAARRRIDDNTTLADLCHILQEEWAAIPQWRVSRLIRSMRNRCLQVIRSQGGHTSY
jgi:hypothetical protein